jgi:hypothetical protein
MTGRPCFGWYHRFVEFVSLAALVHALPEGVPDATWLSAALQRHWSALSATSGVRAWSVGGVQDNETLVQSRPVVRDPKADFLADLLRVPTQTTLAAYAASPPGHDPDRPMPAIAMTRFQRWVGVRAEADLHADARAALAAQLPDFLLRSSGGQPSDRALVVFGFLAGLHADGGLGKQYAPPEQIRQALTALDERLGRPQRINLLVCDGRTVGVLHRGGQFVAVPAPVPARPRAISQPHTRAVGCALLFDPQPAPDPGATVVEPGVFTTSVRQPGLLER